MSAVHILIMDRDEAFLDVATEFFMSKGYKVDKVSYWPDALRLLSAHHFDAVLLDVKMSGGERVEMLRTIKRKYPLIEVIMVAESSSMEEAVEGLKIGAYDFIVKPLDESDAAKKTASAVERKKYAEEKIRNVRIKRIISHPMAVFEKETDCEQE